MEEAGQGERRERPLRKAKIAVVENTGMFVPEAKGWKT